MTANVVPENLTDRQPRGLVVYPIEEQ
jgi:hypothetical protein